MIGTNNTGHRQEAAGCTAKGVGKILDELTERLPETEILLLSIFPRGETRDDALRQINSDINSRLAEYGNGPNVTWLDINSALLTDDGKLPEEIMPDLLHPNETGYKIWAETMHPVLLDLLDCTRIVRTTGGFTPRPEVSKAGRSHPASGIHLHCL